MTAVPRRKPVASKAAKPVLDLGELLKTFKAFRLAKNTEATSKKTAEQLRDEKLMPALIAYGEAHGEKGQHLAIELPEPVDGLKRLVRRSNVSRLLDVDAAEALLDEKGLLAECQTVSVSLADVPATDLPALEAALAKAKLDRFGVVNIATRFSQDAMYAYHQKHRDELTEEEIDDLIVEETSYSFFPEK